jgi:hypothetical protein
MTFKDATDHCDSIQMSSSPYESPTADIVDFLNNIVCYCDRGPCVCGASIPDQFIPFQARVRGYITRVVTSLRRKRPPIGTLLSCSSFSA